MRTQQQSHALITGQTYRDIQQTFYAPIDGVDPKLGDAATPTPAAAAPASVVPQPHRGRPDSSPTSPTSQAEFTSRYTAVMTRIAQDRSALVRVQRKLSVTGFALPDDVRAAQDRLNSQQQAFSLAMRTRDNVAAEQRLRDLEDTLAVIEKFIGK